MPSFEFHAEALEDYTEAFTWYSSQNEQAAVRFEQAVQEGINAVIPHEEVAKKVSPQDVVLNEEYAMLEIFPKREEGARVHEPLENILWLA